MVVDIAAVVIAIAFALLVGFLVPVLIQLKQTASEAQRLLAHMDLEVPDLMKKIRLVTENLSVISDQTREGVEHASTLFHAVGEVGDSVHQVHHVMRNRSGNLVANLASILAGIRAASTVVKDRVHHTKEGGDSNGKR